MSLRSTFTAYLQIEFCLGWEHSNNEDYDVDVDGEDEIFEEDELDEDDEGGYTPGKHTGGNKTPLLAYNGTTDDLKATKTISPLSPSKGIDEYATAPLRSVDKYDSTGTHKIGSENELMRAAMKESTGNGDMEWNALLSPHSNFVALMNSTGFRNKPSSSRVNGKTRAGGSRSAPVSSRKVSTAPIVDSSSKRYST